MDFKDEIEKLKSTVDIHERLLYNVNIEDEINKLKTTVSIHERRLEKMEYKVCF